MEREFKRILVDESIQLTGVLEGYAPVQAEGTVAGRPFYFHARWNEWMFSITETEEVDAVDMQLLIHPEPYGFTRAGHTGNAYEASWMPLDDAESIIKQCSKE
ncbi:hypothetical protein [Hymenobacter pini]|uniref:hypothetical protein n=1 Tax=Hymenobacter pini TaxID=2880879 RepID=UPI001CF3D9CE|nr:hypothetical protein [Hymenobacter pini]MCA8832281.1 hypothetical protein [Hymenobacter pini]